MGFVLSQHLPGREVQAHGREMRRADRRCFLPLQPHDCRGHLRDLPLHSRCLLLLAQLDEPALEACDRAIGLVETRRHVLDVEMLGGDRSEGGEP